MENNNDTSGGTSNEPTKPASDSDNENLIDMVDIEGLHRKIKSLWSTGRQEHRRYVPKILDYTSTQPRDNEWNAHT